MEVVYLKPGHRPDLVVRLGTVFIDYGKNSVIDARKLKSVATGDVLYMYAPAFYSNFIRASDAVQEPEGPEVQERS